MNSYVTALRRLFNYKKYPLFRTVPLRYIFLHILLLAVLLSMPAIIHLSSSITSVKQLIAEKEHEIPDFHIRKHQLELAHHQDKVIHLKHGTISFTEAARPKQHDIITFAKHQIYLQDMEPIHYQNIAMITGKASMISMLKTYTQSSYFYLVLLSLFLIAVQFSILTIKIIVVSFIAHLAAVLFRRKSRYMNWLKITAFLITLPTILQLTDLLISNALLNPLSWCIMILLICLAVFSLPEGKRLSNSN